MENETNEYYDRGLGGGRDTLDAKKFWRAANEEKLLIQQCEDCTEAIYPPQDVCPYCWSSAIEWSESSGDGTILTYSTTHVAIHSTWADEIPYTLGYIQLPEGAVMLSEIVDCDPEEIEMGDRVEVVFREVPGEEGLFPLFRPIK